MSSNVSDLSPISEQPIASPAAPAASASSGGAMFQPLLYLRRHPWVAAITFLLILIAGGAFLRAYIRPIYSAESVIYVSPTHARELTDVPQEQRDYDSFLEQQIIAVTRYSNMKQAIDKFPNFWKLPNEDEQSAISRLQKALKIQQMGHGFQLTIDLMSQRRAGLADFVNQITAGYLASARNDESFGRDDTIANLTHDRQELSTQIDSDLQKQDELMRVLKVAKFDPTNTSDPFDAQLEKLRDQLAEAHEKRAEADAQVNAFNATTGGVTGFQAEAGSQAALDPSLTAMQTTLSTRRAAVLLQMNGLTPQNPLYIQSKEELAAIDKQLDEISHNATDKAAVQLKQRYTAERDRAVRLESQLNRDLNTTESNAVGAAPRLQQAQLLSEEILRLQANYATVDNRIRNLLVESNSIASEHIVSWAMPPLEPVEKHVSLYLLGLLLAALVGALIAAFLATTIDPKIYTAQDIRRLIGFPPIGLLLDAEDFAPAIREEYLLRLASGIDQAHRRTGARTFVFTSAGVGETRDLVQGLGSELAAGGLTTLVILVGDSVAEPLPNDRSLHSSSGSFKPGIEIAPTRSRTDIGIDFANDRDAVIEPFEVVTKAPQRIAEFLRKSRTNYDTILIGADPILLSAHSEHLARIADGTILVAESGKITKKQLGRVARLLERLKVSGIAVVLSEISKRRADPEIIENVAEYAQRPVRT